MYGLKKSDIVAYNQLVKYMDNCGYFGPLLMLHEIVSMTLVLNILTSMNQIISSPLLPNIMQSPYIGVERTIWYYLLIGIMKRGTLTFLCLNIYQQPQLASKIQNQNANNMHLIYLQCFHMANNSKWLQKILNITIRFEKSMKHIQYVAGTLIYYGRSVDPTMIHAVNKKMQVQYKPTQ